MITEDQKEKFIKLRAKGYSFDKISEILNISKPTLLNASRKLSKKIANYKELYKEQILEELRLTYKNKLESLSKTQERVIKEILDRDLSDVPIHKLFEIYQKCDRDINRLKPDSTTFKDDLFVKV